MIKINESKAIYTNPNLDVTIIEVYKNEYPNINAFLSIDEQIFQKNHIKIIKIIQFIYFIIKKGWNLIIQMVS